MSGPGGPSKSDAAQKARVGAYRRAIRIVADGDSVTAEMEDDVHHFGITLSHADGRVTGISGSAWRTPWSICPGALQQLETVEGALLADLLTLPTVQRAEHCMHLYDLVLLAARHAGKPAFSRHYRVEGDHDQAPPVMRLWRDGPEILGWAVVGGTICGSKYDGIALKDLAGVLLGASAEDAEAALVLRRATLIAPVRLVDLDAYRSADHINPRAPAVCYARQPQRTASAARNQGTSRDFYGHGQWPLETLRSA